MTTKDDKSQGKAKEKASDRPNDREGHVTAAHAADDQVMMLKKKVEELNTQIAQLKDTASRAQADLQNAKIRMQKESDELSKFASEGWLKKLIPMIDNFQRAFAHLPEDLKSHEWVKGVAAIESDLIKKVTEMGLKKIESLGKTADPSRHEVLMTGDGEEGKVTDVFEDGYELHGKVLRPAKVKVGTGKKAS